MVGDTRREMPDIEEIAAKHVVGGLAEVLSALGAELRQANTAGEDTIVFGGADVELNLALEAKAGGGIKFWVVNAEAGSAYARGAKVTVHVYPGAQEGWGVGK